MGEIKRASETGIRWTTAVTPAFKREQISRVGRGELTTAELIRELDVHPRVVRNWQRLVQQGATAAVEAGGDVVPAVLLREAEKRIRDFAPPSGGRERALGRKTMEVDILQVAQEEVKKRPSYYGMSKR